MIEDTPERVVTFIPVGTIVSIRCSPTVAGSVTSRSHERWAHPRVSARRPWHGPRLIQLFPKGRAHSLWVVRDAEHSLLGWYVNLEDPHVLGARTITTQDHVLDIWVPGATPGSRSGRTRTSSRRPSPSGGSPPPKQRRSAPKASASGRERPWPTGWEEWLPPTEWAQPELPDGWNED